MAHVFQLKGRQKFLAGLTFCVGLTFLQTGNTQVSGLVNLTQVPLTTATTTTVLPNIMFTLDDSGSMAWDFMPDWVHDDYPRSTNADLYRNSAFNIAFYDPSVTYSPPTHFNADGSLNTTTYPSKSSGWSSVKYDAYGVSKWNADLSSRPNQLCPDGSDPSGSSASTYACDLSGGKARYFTFVAGEYCTRPELKVCIAATAPSPSHPYPAPLRWCNNAALAQSGGTNECQSLRGGAFVFKRHPSSSSTSTATLTVAGGKSPQTLVKSVKVNGFEILNAPTNDHDSSNTVASRIRDGINACTAAKVGACTIAGYSATVSGSVVTITAPGAISYIPVVTKDGAKTITPTPFSFTPGNVVYTEINTTPATYSYPGTSAKHPNRTDCTGVTCTYNEEMTNYANWFAYYHLRTTMMKSGVSRAFKTIDNKFRVGFNLINYSGATDGTNFLHIDKFELAHKNSWYVKLFASTLNGSTPLQGALGKVGRLFANKVSGQADPVQYSCQQNFSILSTDGYWNSSSDDYSLGSGTVGNMDGGTTARPMKEGTTATSDSLADIAKYYYDTDLRRSDLSNCTGALGQDVCLNNVFVSTTDNNVEQHMTSFTIGLGADGTLVYGDDYLTATTGDFADLTTGVKNWPNPIANSAGERIDDLWHAAVNGHGEYFSARNPDQIVKGLSKALRSITAKTGAGAAAATSTLNPVSSDNFAFVASYTTVSWRGNLEARKINVLTGATSEDATACVEDVVADSDYQACAIPSTLVNDTSGSSNVWYCVTPMQSTCSGGTLVGTDCKVEVATACTGTLKSKVSANSDTRRIYMKNATGTALVDFKFVNMTPMQKAYFSSPTALSQWPNLTSAQQTLISNNLVDYLRGQTGYEDRTTNTNKLFRLREATLGDAVESQPIFIGKPTFKYTDTGYDAFITAKAGRAKMVFLGTNDGMLHAFDSTTLEERWAYVPSMVMPNMWKLADKNYATLHQYFVNGPAVTSDVYYGGVWRSILVGSLHGGGRGYYALDVTDPENPLFLWEFAPTQITDHALIMDPDLGYSFAEPKIGKLPAVAPAAVGQWKVFLSSGYNNVSPGDGKGHVYVLDPITGNFDAVKDKINTTEGSSAIPSGLAKIEFWADSSETNNTAKFIYGGDLGGNVWRITPRDNGSGSIVYDLLKFAVLKDSLGVVQPITTRPELAEVNGKRVIYVATGKYLEQSDLSTTQKQSLYAIKDDNASATFSNPRTGSGANVMVQQTLTNSGALRKASSVPVSFLGQRGWFLDFPDSGERAHVDPRLEYGVVILPTTIPTSTACSPGGSGWLNFLAYQTGAAVPGVKDGAVAQKSNTPVVGVNIISVGGATKASTVEAGDPTPRLIEGIKFDSNQGLFQGKRVIWRELVE